MGYALPQPSEMFGGAADTADRFEQYQKAINASHAESRSGNVGMASVGESGTGKTIVKRSAAAGAIALASRITKGLTADQQSAMAADIAALKGFEADLTKDWSVTFPDSAGLVPYDLEAPAKLLVPRETPLRNSLPRTKGQGVALQIKRITGWTNSGVGGVADASAFFSSESASTAFGSINLRRPSKITYAAADKTFAYMEQGLSDLVTWKAEFTGRGYQDIRTLSQTAALWASMGAEERALLFARGTTANGYAGPVSAPIISGATATTGGSIAAGTYQITVTARAGFGESVVSNRVAQVTTGSTSTITVTVATEPTGALGYNLYVSLAGGGAGSETFQASFVGNTITLTTPPTSTGAAIPGADSTASALAYDGFLTVQADPTQSGYVNRANVALSSVGDAPYQTAFLAMYGGNLNPGGGTTNGNKLLANPDEVWIDGGQRYRLGQWLKLNASTVSYRLMLQDSTAGNGVGGSVGGGTQIGAVVGGINNQTTGKMVDFNVHPYMPLGCAFIRSRTLPVPNSEISNTAEVRNVQDYMAIEWPVIQMTYDLSTYWFGTLVHYAPAWSGLIIGLQ